MSSSSNYEASNDVFNQVVNDKYLLTNYLMVFTYLFERRKDKCPISHLPGITLIDVLQLSTVHTIHCFPIIFY